MKRIAKMLVYPIMVLSLILGGTGCDTIMGEEVGLEASGVIETTEILLTSEFGGLVADVTVREGERASAGQVLVHFDDAYLQTQHDQAQADLAQARANLAQVESLTELETLQAQQALDDLYENADMARAQAQMAVINAREELALAQNEPLTSAEIELELVQLQQLLEDQEEDREAYDYQRCKDSTTDTAYAEYLMAKETLKDEQKEYDESFAYRAEDDIARAVAMAELSEAKQELERAQANLNWCKGKPDELDVSEIDAEILLTEAQIVETLRELESYTDPDTDISKLAARVETTQETLEQAQRELAKLQDGPDPDAVALAEARLAAAESGMPVAEAQVQVAEAALDAIQVHFDKLAITAPVDSVVLVRLVEPGEVVAPGSPLVTLAQLDALTITVFLPEDQYGQIKVGQGVEVSVDSFPGVVFDARVKRIADEAEYTPRNVQTKEDRRTIVFAIELSVEDPDGRLKPGMPADVNFLMGVSEK